MNTDDEFAQRAAFYELGRMDKPAMRSVHSSLEKSIDRALARFYVKIEATPELRSFFRDSAQMSAASKAQRNHWLKAFETGPDEAYRARAARIGETHARIGLEPKWYVGGYSLILEEVIWQMVAPGWTRVLPWRRALARRLTVLTTMSLLDMDLALTGYFKNSNDKIHQVVGELGRALNALADGKLGETVSGLPAEYSAIEDDYNNSAATLRSAMGAIIETTGSLEAGSREIRAASDDLSNRTEQQAASLEETAAALSSVTRLVQDNANITTQARQSIASAHDRANQGGEIVRDAIAAMGRIEDSSRQASQIISTIDGIAFQTNLLALNAGVEAARAGEAGRGFAVVASEVRALAQRSAEAANQIKDLLGNSGQEVGTGVTLVGRTGEALEAVLASIALLRGSIDEIATSGESQARDLGQINSSVGEMDHMTQQNAAMAEECTAAARSLASQSQALTSLVERFDLGAEAGRKPPLRRAA